MAELDLSHYSDTPLFNTKAVVQETGISAATLRAWERRYGVPEPDRTDNNYRLYSERDIALIRWLRERIEGGVTISQAVELYERARQGKEMPNALPGEARSARRGETHDWVSAQERLIQTFKNFDEPRADQILNEMFALYAIEDVLTQLIQPAMVEIGEQWHQGQVSIPVEHFTTAYVERKLMTLMNAQPSNPQAPLVVVGCAPHEQHEIGVLLFALFLRRNGMRVLYLGQNVPMVDLRAALESLEPAMLALSATTIESAEELIPIGEMIESMPSPSPLFAFGGAAFDNTPELIERVAGLYLGQDAPGAVRRAIQHVRSYSSG